MNSLSHDSENAETESSPKDVFVIARSFPKTYSSRFTPTKKIAALSPDDEKVLDSTKEIEENGKKSSSSGMSKAEEAQAPSPRAPHAKDQSPKSVTPSRRAYILALFKKVCEPRRFFPSKISS